MVAGVVALVAPVLLLPGLAWGAAGRLRPVAYPASWLAVARMVNDDPDPGAVLLLPWTAYRSPGWDGGRTVLDPWPRLLSRPVLWNDGGLVGHVQLPPDDQRSRDLTSAVRSGGPLTAALRAAGVRFVIVDAGSPPAGRLAGCRLLTPRRAGAASPVVYRVPPG